MFLKLAFFASFIDSTASLAVWRRFNIFKSLSLNDCIPTLKRLIPIDFKSCKYL